MVWYGIVQYGTVRYSVVWCGVVRYGALWYVEYSLVLSGLGWHGYIKLTWDDFPLVFVWYSVE